MDRLYTGFVSSTFLDLIDERELIARSLLEFPCVPLGMEFFPSTGRTQWPVIQDTMSSSDFCVFLIAGRYGSISEDVGISWTHREFREAIQQGKPVVALLHRAPSSLPMTSSEATATMRDKLNAFRKEVEDSTVCRYYEDRSDLVAGLFSSIRALEEEQRIEGWVRAGKHPVLLQETDYDRVYERLEHDWSFSRSAERSDRWDACYAATRVIRGMLPEGLSHCTVDFTRDADSLLPFSQERYPKLTLRTGRRTGTGTMSLAAPRKITGAAFAQDVQFMPPVGQGETVSFHVEAEIPQYKFAYREDLLAATVDTKIGPRTFDYASRNIAYPTRRLVTRIFLDDDLGATPAGPKVGRAGFIDRTLNSSLVRDGRYSETRVQWGGKWGTQMSLDVDEPRLMWRYRLGWNLPRRRDGPAST